MAMGKNGWNYTTIFKNDSKTTEAGVLEVCETESTIESTVPSEHWTFILIQIILHKPFTLNNSFV